MKRIIITEKQEKFLKEAMEKENSLLCLPSHLIQDIKMEETSVSMIDLFSTKYGKHYLEDIIKQEFNNIISSFEDDVTDISKDKINTKLDSLINKCLEKETPIKNELEKICFNIISEIFELPENSFEFECHLLNNVHNNSELPIHAEPSIDSINITPEIQKRRFINMLCVGGANYILEKSFELIRKHISRIDGELPDLYERIIIINELSLLCNEIHLNDDDENLLGFCKVTLGDEEHLTKIESNATIFPILLYESIKGFMEIFGTYSLTETKSDSEQIMKVADALEFEPWDMRIGKHIFKTLFVNEDLDSKYLPYIFREFSEQSPEIINILVNEHKDEVINKLTNIGIRKYEYESFEYDIMAKQSDESIITDEFDVEENNDEVNGDYYGWE